MKKKLILPLTMATLLTAGTLASCGFRNNYAYDLDFTVDVRGQTITMWGGFGSDITDVIEKKDGILAEFERLTGVHVKYESKSDYNTCLKAVMNSATSGAYPNVVVGYPDHFASYVKSNIIVRLNYYFENDVHNDTFEPDGVNFSKSDFYDQYMEENDKIEFNTETEDPYTLGIPFNKSTEVMAYNKAFFDYVATRNDLNTNIYLPATYAEVESVGQAILNWFATDNIYGKILANDGNLYNSTSEVAAAGKKVVINLKGIIAPGSDESNKLNYFKPISYDSQANWFISTLRQVGETYTTVEATRAGTYKGYLGFNTDGTNAALREIRRLHDANIFGIPADWGESKYGSKPFIANKTVMTVGSSAGVRNSIGTGSETFDVGIAPVPYRTADKKYVISQGANLALLDKGSREQRVASWQLMKFLTKYANGYFSAATGYFPTCEYAQNGGMWKGYAEGYYNYDEWYQEAILEVGGKDAIKAQAAKANLDHYVNTSENWYKFVDNPFAGRADVRDTCGTIIPSVIALSAAQYGSTETAQKAAVKSILDTIYSKLSSYVK